MLRSLTSCFTLFINYMFTLNQFEPSHTPNSKFELEKHTFVCSRYFFFNCLFRFRSFYSPTSTIPRVVSQKSMVLVHGSGM